MLVLRLNVPACVGPDVGVVAAPKSMSTWTVEEVASWMESVDMAGPAAYFRSQGVNGQDLMSFVDEEHLRRELGTTVFVARKVLSVRDSQAWAL